MPSEARRSASFNPIQPPFGKNIEAALSMLAFFVMPVAAILSVTAEDLTVILLGEKWRAAGSLLSIIALRGIFNVVEGSQGWLHLSIGRADRWQNWGIVSLVVQVVAVLAGSALWPEGSRHRSGHSEHAHCHTVDKLCRPPDWHWRCTGDAGRGPATRRRNRHRGCGLVAAIRVSRRLFRLCADRIVGLLLHLHLPCHWSSACFDCIEPIRVGGSDRAGFTEEAIDRVETGCASRHLIRYSAGIIGIGSLP